MDYVKDYCINIRPKGPNAFPCPSLRFYYPANMINLFTYPVPS